MAQSGLVLAVDGGNSKTDVLVVDAAGAVLSWVRGPGSALSPRRTARLLARLAAEAADEAGLDGRGLAGAHGAYYLAGLDLPAQFDAMRAELARDGLPEPAQLGNDAWPLVRLGAGPHAPAVAVVCGAGLKCVGRAAGARFEFPSLGWQTGDLSGGGDFLAREAVRACARAEDGRGRATGLVATVRGRLGVPSIRAIGEGLADGSMSETALGVLAVEVLAASGRGDPVASSIVDTLATEVATLAGTARRHLVRAARTAPASPGPDSRWVLVLGGGLFADPAARLLRAVRAAAPELDTEFAVVTPAAAPVAGAALLGLDGIGAVGLDTALAPAILAATPRAVSVDTSGS